MTTDKTSPSSEKKRSAKLDLRPPRGMRDFLGPEVSARRRVVDVIRRTYEEFGFEPLETPAVEDLDMLLDKYGEEGEKLLFKVLKRGEKLHAALAEVAGGRGPADRVLADLGLRYDLTVPLARVVAGHLNEIPIPYKRYQIQPVWRADRPAKGRFREFYQCDVDVVGAPAPVPEAELLAAASVALERLGFQEFTIRLNHRRLLFGLLSAAGIQDPAVQAQAVVALDKLDKIGWDKVLAELADRGVADPEAVAAVFRFPDGERHDPARMLQETASRLPAGQQAVVEELQVLTDLLAEGPAAGRIVLDPTLARGLSYYTGAIFEIVSPGLSVSLGGGGRYDELIAALSGRAMPAAGISLGLERILEILAARAADEAPGFVEVLVTCWDDSLVKESLRVAARLRRDGLKVDVFPVPGKLKKQLKYAARRGAPVALIIGPEEAAAGRVAVKDLRTGRQDSVPGSELAAHVHGLLAGEQPGQV